MINLFAIGTTRKMESFKQSAFSEWKEKKKILIFTDHQIISFKVTLRFIRNPRYQIFYSVRQFSKRLKKS